MSTSPLDASGQAAGPKRRWFKVRVVAAALILVIGFSAWLSWRNGLPPRLLATLSSGRVYLDIPQMTFYTFPPLQVEGFYATTNASFTLSAAIVFTWVNVTGVGLPVRFVLTASDIAEAGPPNGFVIRPAEPGTGTAGYALSRPGTGGVVYTTEAMDYTIREVAVYDWLGEDRWVEVDYSLTSIFLCVCDLPAANTTFPPPSAVLESVGIPVGLRFGPGFVWSYAVSVRQFPLASGPFTHALPPVSLPAGTAGTIGAILLSSFSWGPGDNYSMHMGGSNGVNVSVKLYFDTRFGSLFAEYGP